MSYRVNQLFVDVCVFLCMYLLESRFAAPRYWSAAVCLRIDLMCVFLGRWHQRLFLIRSDYREYHTDTTVRFTIKLDPAKMKEFDKEGFHKVFKLHTTLSLSNLVLFDSNGVIKIYSSVGQIMEEFYKLRLDYYQKQKVYWVAAFAAEAKKLQNMARFIEEKIAGKIKVENVKRAEILKLLKEHKYDPDPIKEWKKTLGEAAGEEEPASNEDETAEERDVIVEGTKPKVGDMKTKAKDGEDKSVYDYLMGMSFWKLSNEQKMKLLAERDAKVRVSIQSDGCVCMWAPNFVLFDCCHIITICL